MKRKLEFGDGNNQSKLIKPNDHYQLNFCDLPFEIHFEILNYLDSTIDGGNYVLTCKELYRSLYSTHDLFLSCRVIRDLARLVKRVNIPTFAREKKKQLVYSALNNFEKKLSNTVKELVGSVKQVEQTLENKEMMARKISEWNIYLDEVEEQYGKDFAKVLDEMIFSKCIIVSSSNERMDYRQTYNAEVMIGDIKITHYAYDEEGCNTNWSLGFNQDNEFKNFAELDEGDELYLNDTFDDLKERIGLNDNLPDKLVIDTIIMTLPWGNGWNCVFYEKVLRET